MSASQPLTPRQRQILDWIRQQLLRFDAPPTRAELCEAFGFRSPNAAEQHLRALQRKGAIEMEPGLARGIRLAGDYRLQRGQQLSPQLPLIGRVAAGQPLLAVEHVEGLYDIDPRLFRPRADYLLRVRGQSMRDTGIIDGDLLAVHRSNEARDGQIVVARIDDEVTVKTFRRQGDTVQLLPANPDFQPIVVDAGSPALHIEGLAVGVIRNDFQR